MPENPASDRDPLDLDAVDQRIRINELREQLDGMGMSSFQTEEDCPPEVEEEFLRGIVAYESAPEGTRFAQLQKAGVVLPPPDALDDAALHAKLWEVVRKLAELDVYLSCTNHLSDRQLYEHLWSDSLREPVMILPPGSGWRCHLDMIGSGSDEDIDLMLRYYSSEESRASWAKDFPSMSIPPREVPPFDRDKGLPQAPQPPMMSFGEDDLEDSEDDEAGSSP